MERVRDGVREKRDEGDRKSRWREREHESESERRGEGGRKREEARTEVREREREGRELHSEERHREKKKESEQETERKSAREIRVAPKPNNHVYVSLASAFTSSKVTLDWRREQSNPISPPPSEETARAVEVQRLAKLIWRSSALTRWRQDSSR